MNFTHHPSSNNQNHLSELFFSSPLQLYLAPNLRLLFVALHFKQQYKSPGTELVFVHSSTGTELLAKDKQLN